jgi:hypothetical protein
LNADDAGADPRTAFVQDASVTLLVMDTGDTAARKMQVFFCSVASKTLSVSTGANAKYVLGLIVTKKFTDVTIPA